MPSEVKAKRAIVRAVPASYATLYAPPADPGFLERARSQHRAYTNAILSAGWALHLLEADEAHPDCHFVEDTAVVVGGLALVCHLGRADRRGEPPPVAAALRDLGFDVELVAPPATLEGGDVLQVGKRVFVGRSARTNDYGIAALREVCRRQGRSLEVVPVANVLHLKTGCSAFAPDGVLWSPKSLPGARFEGLHVVTVADDEAYAANCLALGERVLLPAGHLRTAAALEAQGYKVSLLPMSAFAEGDGALTCLSILLH